MPTNEVIALLRSDWRENLVGAVALLALVPSSRPLPALWERIEQWSSAVPQLSAVASIVDHTFAARATELLNRLEESAERDHIADNPTAAAKTAASLLALVEHTQARACDRSGQPTTTTQETSQLLGAQPSSKRSRMPACPSPERCPAPVASPRINDDYGAEGGLVTPV